MVLAAISDGVWCSCFANVITDEAESAVVVSRPIFDFLQKQRPSRRPDKDGTERHPPSFPGEVAQAAEQEEEAECPICCGALGDSPAEVGALTFKGKRVEKDLYHVGCFTMMLSHNGGFRGERVGHHVDNIRISWGTSPTTRQPVDGFIRMPPIEDRKGWIQFLDWKGTGQLDLPELATATAVLLPLKPSALELFMRENFEVSSNDEISVVELEQKVLPYIGEHFASIRDEKEQEKRSADRLRGQIALQRLEAFCDGSGEAPAQIVATIAGLQSSVQEGDALAISVLTRLLTVQQREVREQAARFLPRLVAPGDPQAFEALSPHLQHASGWVRQLVLEVLGQVAMQGDRRAFDEVSFLLGDRQPQVKAAAIRCLVKIAEPGDERAMQAICSRLRDRDLAVRRAAVEALAQLADRGNQPALEQVMTALADREGAMRMAALMSLAELAPFADQSAIQAATSKLEDSDTHVRRAAVKAVAILSSRGNKECRKAALQAAIARLSDPEAEVRRAAVSVLPQVADKDDRTTVGHICTKLQEKDSSIRREALQALEQLVVNADASTVKATGALLKDVDFHTRRAAEQVHEQLKQRQKSTGLFSMLSGRR
eukprot:TRINITY_DN32495_c0_g1_i1.p1 TRINITY_DN32495_c0_g1~~TRINITY_DN32495_c0_g1_i1.p1  ORF type:complete len:620 (+),score=149.83 TRINITY_DN32495_c0_g1_i1:56-1861(+)